MEIKEPIFILAPARSGTTIFYNLFTRHKNTCFPEHFIDKYWNTSWKFRFIPIMVKQQMIRYKIRPLPHEGRFWRKFHSFSTYLDERSISLNEKKYIFSAIKAEMKAFKAERFVDRVHDHMLQIRFLNALFPDAFYIVLSRDPRAIVNSQYTLMKKDWNLSYNKETYGDVITKFGKGESLLDDCINYYKYYTSTMKKDLLIVKSRTIEVKYEKFVNNPRVELKKIFNFTNLEWYDDLENQIPDILELKNNQKWLQLPESEKNILQKEFRDYDY